MNLTKVCNALRISRAGMLALAAFVITASSHSSLSQTVNHVYSFTSQGASQYPQGPLTQGRDGRLYGATVGGVCGSLFKITVSDILTELNVAQFASGCSLQGILLGSDGNYYGTAANGGGTNNGVLFRLTPTGNYTVLHDFSGGNDGASPFALPIQGTDGALYGATDGDATGSTVYKYTLSGNFTTIYQFDGTAGQGIIWPLLQTEDGNLYGATAVGGAHGCGTIFKLSTAGSMLQFYSFPCGAGGSSPNGPLIRAADGNFYGTTYLGGRLDRGTVFKATPDFQVSVLYTFLGGATDGRRPTSGLTQATDGNLYGTTLRGGAADMGTLFQISPSGTYRSLYNFRGKAGQYPFGPVIQQTGGLLWGTAANGGANNLGTVFALNMGLGPFITFVQRTGKVGQTAQILGQGLKGTTSVTFNGVPATTFFAGADTYLRVLIPSGASSGPVVVTTASGALTSNVNFVVLP